jgi:hypothetical protein
VTGDNFVVPQDVLQVINFLNGGGGGEGEAGDSGRYTTELAVIVPPDASPISNAAQRERVDRGRKDELTVVRSAAPVIALPVAAQREMEETLDDLAEELARLWSRSGENLDDLMVPAGLAGVKHGNS